MANVTIGLGLLAENSLKSAVEAVKEAEKIGFSHVWIAEDYFYGGAFSTAAVLAANTKKINIGIGVVNPYTRHPVLTAMETAVLDIASGGRIILGMGASNPFWMEQKMGIPYKNPLTSVNEASCIIRRLLNGEKLTFNGTQFTVKDVELEMKEHSKNIPIFYGVKGEKAVDAAVEFGDGLLLSIMCSKPYIEVIRAQVAETCTALNKNPANFTVAAYLCAAISENRQQARESVKANIAAKLGIHGRHRILTSTGMSEEEIDAFRDHYLNGKSAVHLVTEKHIDTFALAGTPVEVQNVLHDLCNSGITHPIIFQTPEIPLEKTLEQCKKYLL